MRARPQPFGLRLLALVMLAVYLAAYGVTLGTHPDHHHHSGESMAPAVCIEHHSGARDCGDATAPAPARPHSPADGHDHDENKQACKCSCPSFAAVAPSHARVTPQAHPGRRERRIVADASVADDPTTSIDQPPKLRG